MPHYLSTRLARLEDRYRPVCRRCYGHPYRIVLINEATNELISESYPDSGCPECGAPIQREIRIVGGDGMEMP